MKRFTVTTLSLILIVMTSCGQEKSSDRKPAAAGRFYPAQPEILRKDVESYLVTGTGIDRNIITRALIVPHAGYVYSGKTAGVAYASIPSSADYDRIFLIGTSHRYSFEGASIFTGGNLITPLGIVNVDRETGKDIEESNACFLQKEESHTMEHSLEVQLPFIQCHFEKNIPVVPILVGTGNPVVLQSVARSLQPYFNERNLFIISSDFSHYPSYEDACRVDRQTMEAILKGDPDSFIRTLRNLQAEGTEGLETPMCGWSSALILLYLCSNEGGIELRHLDYSNSGDSSYGDKQEVVGYQAITAVKRIVASTDRSAGSDPGFAISEEEKKILLNLARQSIKSALFNTKMAAIDQKKLTPVLKQHLGAFVTLTINGELRGCIGRFMPDDPLYEVVESMAVAAAFNDTRFHKLTAEEYPEIEIEISVLGPLRKINDIREIVIGKHGLYIKKGIYSGTLLPQVPGERGWSVEEFLGYTSRDKAGLGWTGWKDADIYVYEAVVFGE